MNRLENVLEKLYEIVQERKQSEPEESYTALLMHKGVNQILKKIGEEATEVVIAAKNGNKDEIIYETSDLLFHLMVLLGYCNIPPNEIFQELNRRLGKSGIDEKKSRTS